MRLRLPALGALFLLLLSAASPAAARLSVGLHIGFDLNEQEAQSLAAVELSDGSWVSLERGEIEAPLLGGLYLRIGAMPRLDLEIGLEGSLREYAVAYEHRAADNASVLPGERFAEDASFGRLSAYAAAKLNVVDLPLVTAYTGAGLGYHLVTPLLGVPLLEAKIVDEGASGAALGPAELLGREAALGGHLLAGLRFRPNFLPIGLGLEGRYHQLAQNDYGDETNRFVAVAFALDLGF